jgi:transposase
MVRGLMTDREWKFFAPFVVATGGKSGRPPSDHRLVLDGVFWIARTGAQWRDLHEHFGKWSSVYRQFRRWTLAGVFELMLVALNDGGGGLKSVQMIDSTIIRAHHHAAGAKGGLKNRVLGAQRVALRQKFISASPAKGSRSRRKSPAAKSRTTRTTRATTS